MANFTKEQILEKINKLEEKTITILPTDWQKGRKCPSCGSDATRPKCMFDMGPGCPRHNPDYYDDSPFVDVPDKEAIETAKILRQLLET